MKILVKPIILVILIGILGFITSWKVWGQDNTIIDTVKIDTVTVKPQDTVLNVNGKIALFIGDSHTSNHKSGWQTIVSKKTGMRMKNVSVSGKTTYWMLEMGVYTIKPNINYCFIYGGANDMYSSITPEEAVNNIQGIIRICIGNGVSPIVLTGFDPKNTNTPNKNYIPKYIKFQKLLLTTIKDATVIDTRVVLKSDCWDGLCHMTPLGHKKIAEKVILDMNLKTY